tara:strand:+ start:1272 stop:2171 length:900 start_codon:yes stop_codon:yes gene_type:complete
MFYVLSSHNIYALRRQFNTLPKNNTTVILNTLNDTFREQAESYCKEEDLRYFITESDGTAATGKNSFLDQFDKDDVPHAVLIDGDDFLTRRGVKCYQRMMGNNDSPDAVVLFNQISIISEDNLSVDRTQSLTRPNEDVSNMVGTKYTQGSVVVDWDILAQGDLVAENVPNIKEEEVEVFKRYITLLQHSMGIDELSTRLVFMSRKVLQYRFKSLVVGEDTLQYLEIKDAHDRGELKLVAHDEKHPTYMYDMRISGIAVKESGRGKGKGFISWMSTLLKELENLHGQNKLHKTRVPITEL